MKLFLKNIGIMKQASVEINGITVIAGENNTGKSTVGRVLYSVFNSFHNIDEQIHNEKMRSIGNILEMIYRSVISGYVARGEFEEIADDLIKNVQRYDDLEKLKEEIQKVIMQYDENFEKYEQIADADELIIRIWDVLQISDEEFFQTVLNKKFDAEFYGQINNIYTNEDSEVKLQIGGEALDIIIRDNEVIEIGNRIDLRTEVIYFDDPFILDEQRVYTVYRNYSGYKDHRTHLKSKLFSGTKDANVIEEIVANNRFEKIYHKINAVCDGNIVSARRNGWGYKSANTDKVLDARNLSTGLKMFVILKTLLTRGMIEFNGTIILDEPEIHLHPEWQLLFAELIVLIQKEFGVHVLLNTHSPYFLNAIEVYAAKHGVSDKCKYYLAEMDGQCSKVEDVTDNIEKIYNKLARPLQKLENERYAND